MRTWDAYKELKRKIEGFQQKLPLFASLSKPSIRDRHWSLIQDATGTQLRPFDPDFCLGHLLDIDVSSTLMDIEEVADGAEKELAIETKLSEMEDKWKNERFRFVEWRGRGVPILVGIPVVLEDLEEVTQKTTPTIATPCACGVLALLLRCGARPVLALLLRCDDPRSVVASFGDLLYCGCSSWHSVL